ncbi:MAG: transglycosylase SLT domain-containing protein, partial [Gemmatimonadaceae bacterium]
MNGIKTILNSSLTRNIGLASAALLATVYTIPRVGSDSTALQTALAKIVVTGENPSVANTAGWDLPNLDNARVNSWVKLFTTNPKVKERFALWLDRKPKYEPMISAKLEKRDMPQDLIYLAMIESGFNPTAKSPAKAGGLWQFISETGRRYGLTVNKRVDERNHPDKATDAALSYLSDLYR